MLHSLWTALSMYSRLPTPRVEWNKDSMQYALCFFPLVGAVQGLVLALWMGLCGILKIQGAFMGIAAALLPFLVTGGIHLDGYADVCDALSSHKEPEKMLAIMKDPHIGAFGVMALIAYLLLSFGAMDAIAWSAPMLYGYGLLGVLCRALSAFGVAHFPCAKTSGLAYTFQSMAARGMVRRAALLTAAACLVAMFLLSRALGTGGIACVLLLFYYRQMCLKSFGGITGDTAGWFVAVSELLGLIIIMLGQRVF